MKMPSGDKISRHLPAGWERSETSNGIPYYLNHNCELTQWDHPAISEDLFKRFESLNEIKYSAYRTAMKIRAVQLWTNMHHVTVEVIDQACSEIDWFPETIMCTLSEVEVVLSKIFSKVQYKVPCLKDKEASIEITLNFILKCIDSGRTGTLNVCAVKAILLALSGDTIQEKYSSMFNIFESECGITKESINLLLSSLLSITECIEEGKTFGLNNIPATLKSLDEDSIIKSDFIEWMQKKDPRAIIWLSTLHRLVIAETVMHEAKCSVCKSFPIIGLRYRCLKCLNTDICQWCFFTNKGTRIHKATHPTKEYCLPTTSTDDVKDFFKQMKNKITRRYRRHQPLPLAYPDSVRHPERSDHSDVHEHIRDLAVKLRETCVYGESKSQNVEDQQPYGPVDEMKQVHSTCDQLLQSSSAELLDKGISVSTFDEFCLGKEDKLLHEMTQRTLDMMSKAVASDSWKDHILIALSSEVAQGTSHFLFCFRENMK